ncbi:hypothetical protein BCR33DRAFT_377766 [Rhizoclosmatium globosum]|uniref:TFIIS N-terminal domain-containing protein n=1 Tax=Rhizoclosmatium globosum TaxID=329046 RepID=A0A1Y2BYY7_9FUNG|nr:hypothetical protein BCR33DRAFT_377766 [Rhizoclosmatium globosum]|eukprot:ORY39894.1 hypothetical protein BCR33DRAFT_377766 [Rhizoclosmatium globosum]
MSRERSKLKESGVAVQSNNNTSTFQRASSIASDESAADANSTTSAGAPPPLNTTPTTPALSETVTSAAPAQITFDDIDFEDPAYVIKYLRFLSTAQTVVEKRLRLDLSEEEVSPEFYEAFAQTKEFRGLILLKKWLLEAKDAGEWELVKDVLNLLEKLPVSVEGLAVTKLGRVVAGLGKVESADGSVKELSAKVTKIWTDVVAKQNAPKSTPEPEPAPAPAPATAGPKTITLEERRRAQKEKEDAIAAEQKAKADALLAKIKTSAPSTTTPAEPSPTSTSATSATEPKFASFSYRKKAAPEPTPPEKEATPEPPAPVVLNEHGVKSILSSTVTPDVDPLHPRKKRKAVTFAAELVKTRYFNIDDDVMAAGDRHFKNKSARDSERGEGRIAFGSGVGGSGGAREVKANGEWRQLRCKYLIVGIVVVELICL